LNSFPIINDKILKKSFTGYFESRINTEFFTKNFFLQKKDPNFIGIQKKGPLRECGPFLLD